MSLLDSPLREQAAAIAAGDADPAELLDAALARIEERNPASSTRSSRPSPSARARCSPRPRAARCAASRW